MLDCSADNLRQEIESALDYRRKITEISQGIIRLVAGNDYRSDWYDETQGHENHHFEIATNLVKKLVAKNPGVEVDSDVSDPDDPQVKALHFGINQWVRKQQLAKKLKRIAFDTCCDFGVAAITMEFTPGYNNGPDAQYPAMWPVLQRISPRRFFADPRTEDFDGKRFAGHCWIRDKEDLLAAVNSDGSPKFDHEAIEALGIGQVDRKDSLSKMDEWLTPERHQVVGFEVYVPETGLIYTLGYCSSGGRNGSYGFLREPRELLYTPKSGPYVLFGCHFLPDQIYPLSPLAVTSSLIREMTAHAEQASRDAASAKRLVLVDATNKVLTEAVTSAENGTVIPIPGGFKGEVFPLEIGGAMPSNMGYMEILRSQLNRLSGKGDNAKGDITGASATEVAAVASEEDSRDAYAKDQFQESVVEVLEIVGQTMHENPDVVFDVAAEDPMTGDRIGGQYRGGPPVDPRTGMPIIDPRTGQPLPVVSWDSMNITLQPYSMENVTQATLQRRILVVTEVTPKLVAMGLQMPWMNIRPMLNDVYESINIKGAASRYVNIPMYEAFRQRAAMAMLMGGMPGGPAPGGSGEGPGPGGPQGEAQQRGQEAGAAAAP